MPASCAENNHCATDPGPHARAYTCTNGVSNSSTNTGSDELSDEAADAPPDTVSA